MSGVLVLVDHTRGNISNISTEMIGLAREIKQINQGAVRVVLIGAAAVAQSERFNLESVDEILQVDSRASEFDACEYQEVAESLVRRYRPSVVLVGHNANGMAYAGGLAVALGAGFAADIFALKRQDNAWIATRSGFGSKLNVTVDFPGKSVVVLSVRAGSFETPTNPGKAALIALPAVTPSARHSWTHEGFIEPPSEGVDISKSEFIMSIGRGVQDEKNVPRFAALANRLGATLACSRPVADSGWLQKSRQVGLTGKPATNCKLYLALGISGAVQHLWGMKHVETIIAVNTDQAAPIFDVATFGATTDLFAIADSIDKALDSKKGAGNGS
jgi:electron transfer flavoprotein alpha subunit